MTSNITYVVALGIGFKCPHKIHLNTHYTEVRFVSFLSGAFITAVVVNPPEKKLAKRTSVQWGGHFDGMPMVADGRGVGVKNRENLPTLSMDGP